MSIVGVNPRRICIADTAAAVCKAAEKIEGAGLVARRQAGAAALRGDTSPRGGGGGHDDCNCNRNNSNKSFAKRDQRAAA